MNCKATIDFEGETRHGAAVIPAAFIVRATVTDIAVDRPDLLGISTGTNHKLAERLVRAIEAGAVFTFERTQQDVNGKTFVVAGCKVSGRRLNADLKRLGF
jgi:hypothetical protein